VGRIRVGSVWLGAGGAFSPDDAKRRDPAPQLLIPSPAKTPFRRGFP
jgi:hypothetical protein